MIVGVVGPKESCGIIRKAIHQIDQSHEVRLYTRELVREAVDVIDICEQECDGVIFTGSGICDYVLGHHQMQKPYTYIKRSASSISEVFLKMVREGREIDTFSIDVVEKQIIEDILDAFHIQPRNIYTCPLLAGVAEEEYVAWHMELLEKKMTDVAVTAYVAVYHMIEEKGGRVFYLEPKRSQVRDALADLEKGWALAQAEYSQIAVELIQMSNFPEKEDQYYSAMASKAEFEVELIRYVRGIQGSVFPFGRDEYVIYANSGVVKGKKNHKDLRILQREGKNLGLVVNAGLGMGLTAYQAEMHARKALEYSLGKGEGGIFQIDEEEKIQGPLGLEQQLQYSMISFDPKIQTISEKTGLSMESILKIQAIADVRKSYVFDASELAECLGITVRSARRILSKIQAAGLGTVCARESAAKGGRPRALVELNFGLRDKTHKD